MFLHARYRTNSKMYRKITLSLMKASKILVITERIYIQLRIPTSKSPLIILFELNRRLT